MDKADIIFGGGKQLIREGPLDAKIAPCFKKIDLALVLR